MRRLCLIAAATFLIVFVVVLLPSSRAVTAQTGSAALRVGVASSGPAGRPNFARRRRIGAAR